MDGEIKGKVKQDAILTLASPTPRAGSIAAQVIAAIAAVELPAGQWPELIGMLLSFMDRADNMHLRVATLQTIGFICETIVRRRSFLGGLLSDHKMQKPDILSLRSNEILTAVIHGARKEESSTEVQLAAINALYNSLEFVRDNFDREVTVPSSCASVNNSLRMNRVNATISCRWFVKPRRILMLPFKLGHLSV